MVSYGGLRKRVLAFERSVFRLGGLGKLQGKKLLGGLAWTGCCQETWLNTVRKTGLNWVILGSGSSLMTGHLDARSMAWWSYNQQHGETQRVRSIWCQKNKIQTNLVLKSNCILFSILEKYTLSYTLEWLLSWAEQRVCLHQQDRAKKSKNEWEGDWGHPSHLEQVELSRPASSGKLGPSYLTPRVGDLLGIGDG